MNKGEGLRYAAHAKSGQINLFKEEKKKPKKFNYKGRGQSHSVRKVQTNPENPPLNAPSTVKKPNATKPQPGTTAKARKPPAAEQRQRTNQKDFVKKNAQSSAPGKGKKETKSGAVSGGGGGGTVTLTQDQLNSILATIGQAAGNNGVPNITLENGNIKLETKGSPNKHPHQNSETSKAPIISNNREDGNTGDENVENTLNKDKNGNEITPRKDNNTQRTQSPVTSTNNASLKEDKSGHQNSHESISRDNERTQASRPGGVPGNDNFSSSNGHPPNSGYGDVSSMMGLNQRELAQQKKLQWKKELDEQIALKQQQQGKTGRRGRGRDNDQETWQPWGQPGAGAPPRGPNAGIRGANAGMKLDLSGVNPVEQSQGLPSSSKSGHPMSSQITPRADVTSSLDKIATQKYTPAAMRSSFIIGGDAIDSHNLALKKKEQQQWLQELERQRRKDQERKNQEKQKQQEFDVRLSSHWADQVTSPRRGAQSVAQPQQVKPVTTVDDSVITPAVQAGVKDSKRETQRHHSADAAPSKQLEGSGDQSHIRPCGLLVDPVEIERQDEKRQKHMEHMLAVKAQVEERQRIKREAMEAKKREEAEEERKLAEERDLLKKQFEMEKEKQKKKEVDAAAKQKAMMESVQAAYEQSQQEKHAKRVQRLASQGHNVDNLRKSWDDRYCQTSRRLPPIPGYRVTYTQQISPQTSPRAQPSQPHVRNSPRLEPITATTNTMSHSPRKNTVVHSPIASPVAHPLIRQSMTHEPSRQAVSTGMQDAATSPVFDQAVQTDFQFPPSDVLLERPLNMDREKSAGIEYKPDRQQKGKPNKQKVKSDKKGKSEDKSKRLTKGKSQDVSEEEAQPKRTTNVKDRPIWGKTNQNKKMLGNTQKDLTGNQKKREERRKKRHEEMMALQEQSAPKRLTQKKEKKKAASMPQSRTNSVTRTDSRPQHAAVASRAATELELRPEKRPVSNAWTQDKVAAGSHPSPPIHSGDFVPFLRNDQDELNERSIPGSPDVRHSQRSRTRGTPKLDKDRSSSVNKKVSDDQDELNERSIPGSPDVRHSQRSRTRGTPKLDKDRSSSVNKKDPLLNPERLKDSNLRQEKILEQLSNLRQGLMMKQRELEMGLSTPLVM